MRATALLFLLLSACSSLGGQDIRLPVAETAQVTAWAAELPGFDRNADGYLDASEVDQFMIWLGFQILSSYAVQPPAGPGTLPGAPSSLPGA